MSTQTIMRFEAIDSMQGLSPADRAHLQMLVIFVDYAGRVGGFSEVERQVEALDLVPRQLPRPTITLRREKKK